MQQALKLNIDVSNFIASNALLVDGDTRNNVKTNTTKEEELYELDANDIRILCLEGRKKLAQFRNSMPNNWSGKEVEELILMCFIWVHYGKCDGVKKKYIMHAQLYLFHKKIKKTMQDIQSTVKLIANILNPEKIDITVNSLKRKSSQKFITET